MPVIVPLTARGDARPVIDAEVPLTPTNPPAKPFSEVTELSKAGYDVNVREALPSIVPTRLPAFPLTEDTSGLLTDVSFTVRLEPFFIMPQSSPTSLISLSPDAVFATEADDSFLNSSLTLAFSSN